MIQQPMGELDVPSITRKLRVCMLKYTLLYKKSAYETRIDFTKSTPIHIKQMCAEHWIPVWWSGGMMALDFRFRFITERISKVCAFLNII